MIPYGRQWISDDDIELVANALRSDLITTGPKIVEFESRFAEYVGAKHAVAVCNGTAALHLAMLVSGVKQGDRVVTSPNTFLASANCAVYVGAIPDFCDIDPVSFNMCPLSLEANWQSDTRAVIAVDYAGQSADMPTIAEIARRNGAVVVEDACHALGGHLMHDGRVYKIGAHPWADITTFSLHPVKTMTTGEGGMLVTDNDEYAAMARRLRTHGMVRDSNSFVGLGDSALDERGVWYYEMHQLGYNFRITDFQGALGISQLNRLDRFVARRREIVARYNRAFDKLPHVGIPKLKRPEEADVTSWHLYTLQLDFASLGATRTEVMAELRKKDVGSHVLYIPVHLQPWYRATYGYGPGKCPSAEECYLKTLSLPLYPMMQDSEVEQVIRAAIDIFTSLGAKKVDSVEQFALQ